MKKVIIAYIPVLHEGYRKFISSHSDAETLYIFGKEIIQKFDYLAKEIRALEPELVKKAIEAWQTTSEVKILKNKDLESLNNKNLTIIIPNEDVTKELAEKCLFKAQIVADKIFLRWDKHSSTEQKPVDINQTISIKEFDRKIVKDIKDLAESNSSDWWRRIGAAVIKDGKVILKGYNKHVPSPHTPYANGDPRNSFHKGINLELSTALHAEAGLISVAASKGINLTGCSMYVSTFPCPPCAKSIAYSGITKLYYTGGYGVLDADSILKSRGVEIIFVDLLE